MKTNKLILCAAALALMVSCVKGPDHDTPGTGNGNEANVFDFATSKQVQVEIAYDLPHNTRIEIYTQNPLTVNNIKDYVVDPELRPLVTGYTDAEGRLTLPVQLASSEDEIYVYSPSAAAPVLLSAKVTGPTVRLDAANVAAPRAAKASRAIADTNVYWSDWKKKSFSFRANPAWSWDAQGRPAYLLEEPMQLDAKTLNRIDAAIPKGEKFELLTAQFSEIEISEEANVSLYFISNSSARRNVLAYFTYTDQVPTQAEINRSLTVLFPNLSSEALATGEGVMLEYYDETTGTWKESFPAGTKIGFALLTDGWEGNGSIASTSQVVYSHKKFNSYTIPRIAIMADRPHMAAFKAGEHFILTFEDLPHNQGQNSPNLGDFSDDVFVMTANPVTALPDVPPAPTEDELPPYVTTIDYYGIVAFEDNWPYKGDYDLNDVALKYESKLHLSYDYDYNAIEESYTFLHNGGKYTNGFGIEYGFDLSALNRSKCSIEAFDSNGNQIALDVPGFDEELTKATLMLFRDAADVPVGTKFKVRLVFNKPQLIFQFLLPPYNPFVTVYDNGGLRKEVHLVDHAPTPKCNTRFFNYGDDISTNGRYYISALSYPFAIHLAKADSYRMADPTVESKCIDEIYPRFGSWASSSGTQDKDWYLD